MYQKLRKLLFLCFFMGIFSLYAFAKDSFYMLPYEQTIALNALKNTLKNAQSEIKISIYSFTYNDIAKILRDSAKRGVRVYIIYDKESNMNNNASTLGYLAKYNNISVCLLSGMRAKNKNYYGIMHQKMAIETLLISHNEDFVAKALQGYDKMMSACVQF